MERKRVKIEDEKWFNSHWRPAMAWQYLVVCVSDFLLAPIVNALLSQWLTEVTYSPWDPLTIRGGGIYHLSMGAILGVTAWTRGNVQAKMVENMAASRDEEDEPDEKKLRSPRRNFNRRRPQDDE